MAKKECEHLAYQVKDGDLACSSCGEPSPNPKWRENVYGVQGAQASAAVTVKEE